MVDCKDSHEYKPARYAGKKESPIEPFELKAELRYPIDESTLKAAQK